MTDNLVLNVVMLFSTAAVLVYAVIVYNGLVSAEINIGRAWSNIDVMLKQRHDEIPMLVEVCKAHMGHESDVLQRVTRARAALPSAAGPGGRAAPEGELTSAVHNLFVTAEAYPALTAQSSFQRLHDRITGLENEIADRREFYNACVTAYNIRIDSVPDTIIAGLRGLKPRELFQVADIEKTKPALGL